MYGIHSLQHCTTNWEVTYAVCPEKYDWLLDLNMGIANFFFELNDWNRQPQLLETFLHFLENVLFGKLFRNNHHSKSEKDHFKSEKAVWGKHLSQLCSFIPKFVVGGEWSNQKLRLVQAFMHAFTECMPSSLLKLSCIRVIINLICYHHNSPFFPTWRPEYVEVLLAWLQEFPPLLMQLGDKPPAYCLVVIRALSLLGPTCSCDPSLRRTYNKIQYSFQDCFCECTEGGEAEPICFGPFLRIPEDYQWQFVGCLEYFTNLEMPILNSILCCCLSHDIGPDMPSRIIMFLVERWQLIKITDFLSFLMALVSRFEVSPEVSFVCLKEDARRNALLDITSNLCTHDYCSSPINNQNFLVIEKQIIQEILLKPSFINGSCLLRILVSVDSVPTKLSEESIATLGSYILEILMEAIQGIPIEYYVRYFYKDPALISFCHITLCWFAPINLQALH